MNRTCIAVFALLLLGLAGALEAQQPASRIQIPEMTSQQRWERAASHVDAIVMTAIAYAKSRGDSAEALGRSIGRNFAASWGAPGSGTVQGMAGGVARNFQLWPAGQVTVVEQTPRSATLRIHRAWAAMYRGGADTYGVTVDDHERAIGAIHEEIATHLGLRVEQRRDGDAMLMIITDPREGVTKR